MQPSIQSYYEQIKDIYTPEEFTLKIQERKKQYDDLFTKEAIAFLLIDEHDRNPQSTIPIKDVHAGMECSIKGTLTEIDDTKKFTRKNNTTGKLKKCVISDETGSIPVILWNDDVDIIDINHLEKGSTITIINGYSKKGYQGIELNVGRWSSIEITTEPMENNNGHTKEQKELIGTINDIEPTTLFFKEDGTEGFIAKITLSISGAKQSIICWNEHVKTIQQYKKGDIIKITNASYRYLNGKQEIHVNGQAQISKK